MDGCIGARGLYSLDARRVPVPIVVHARPEYFAIGLVCPLREVPAHDLHVAPVPVLALRRAVIIQNNFAGLVVHDGLPVKLHLPQVIR